MASLSLKNVSKSYPNGFVAVRDFDLEIADKEFIVFAGPVGCGKSTILRMIAGLEDITSGELLIDGKCVNDVDTKERNVAMIFQNCTLYPEMTVYENMAFGLKMRNLPKEEIDRVVRETAEFLGLADVLECRPKSLTPVQKEKTAFGRAIVRRPGLFLLDEPLANLDAKVRREMRGEVARVYHSLKETGIYVTDDQAEAMALGRRIVVMKDGVIQQVGTPEELYNHPQNKFVAGYFGEMRMNMIDARVTRDEDGVVLEFGGCSVRLPEEKAKLLLDGDYEGKNVTLGVRPEDLHDEEDFLAASPESVIEVSASLEDKPYEKGCLYFSVGDDDCAAVLKEDRSVVPGDCVKLAVDMAKAHLFDKDTQRVIAG